MAVEGSIAITIGGTPEHLELSLKNTRTRAIPKMLASAAFRSTARTYFPLLYGLCPAAHLAAFDAASARAHGTYGEDAFLELGGLERQAVALEALIENLRVLSLEAAHVMGMTVPAACGHDLGALRTSLYRTLPLFLAPSPDTKKIAEQLAQLRAQLPAAAQKYVFGTELTTLLTDESLNEMLSSWAQSNKEQLPAAALLAELQQAPQFALSPSIFTLPRQICDGNSALAAAVLAGIAGNPEFDLAPEVDGHALFTGTLCRRITEGRSPIMPAWLVAARLIYTGLALATPPDPESFAFPLWTYSPQGNQALSFVITARGLLVHEVRTDDQGLPLELHIISPTEWHFAPRGAGAQLLKAYAEHCNRTGHHPGQESLRAEIAKVLFGVDACVPLTFEEQGRKETARHA